MCRVLDTVIRTHDAWSARIDTWVLNKWLADILVVNNTPRVSGKQVKIKYITQIKSRPPVFALFCNVDKLPRFFERFLRFRLQTEFQLEGIYVRFIIRKTETRSENMKRKNKKISIIDNRKNNQQYQQNNQVIVNQGPVNDYDYSSNNNTNNSINTQDQDYALSYDHYDLNDNDSNSNSDTTNSDNTCTSTSTSDSDINSVIDRDYSGIGSNSNNSTTEGEYREKDMNDTE